MTRYLMGLLHSSSWGVLLLAHTTAGSSDIRGAGGSDTNEDAVPLADYVDSRQVLRHIRADFEELLRDMRLRLKRLLPRKFLAP